MTFSEYLDQAWNDHATRTQAVADSFPHGIDLIQTENELCQMVNLVTHVMGEHLGEWQQGQVILEGLKSHRAFRVSSEAEKALQRSQAALQIGVGADPSLDEFLPSDRIRILAMASGALVNHDLKVSSALFQQALQWAETSLEKGDPAHRTLAITGNNLACVFEEKSSRTFLENEFMILAARTARKHWEIAGTWLEVERAEYRLAKTYLQTQNLEKAFEHAQAGMEICQAHSAGALELFFQFEVLALVEKQRGNAIGLQKCIERAQESFDKLSSDEKSWCESTLAMMKSLIETKPDHGSAG